MSRRSGVKQIENQPETYRFGRDGKGTKLITAPCTQSTKSLSAVLEVSVWDSSNLGNGQGDCVTSKDLDVRAGDGCCRKGTMALNIQMVKQFHLLGTYLKLT